MDTKNKELQTFHTDSVQSQACVILINGEYDEVFELRVSYFRISQLKLIFNYFLYVVTAGFFYLFQRWSLSLKLAMNFNKCSQEDMTHVKI